MEASDQFYTAATLHTDERNPVQGLDWMLCGHKVWSGVDLVAKIAVLTRQSWIQWLLLDNMEI